MVPNAAFVNGWPVVRSRVPNELDRISHDDETVGFRANRRGD